MEIQKVQSLEVQQKDPVQAMTVEEHITAMSYWEHFKYEKDLSLVLPVDHPDRVRVNKVVNELQQRWHELANLRK